jgi:Phage integrase, N-terminal SAM-like domain
MATTSTSTAVATIEPLFTEPERLALAGFLAGYTGLTREAYALDLRQFASWCQEFHIGLFQARRADIECFARDLEARGQARATITRRLCTIAGFYRYAVEEELLDHSPAAHVRWPRLDYESHATGLDRNELGALLVAAGLGPPAEHALISLLALNGLRVSEATGANTETWASSVGTAPCCELCQRSWTVSRVVDHAAVAAALELCEYLKGRAVAEGCVQPLAVAGDLDVAGDGEPGMGPVWEGLPVIHLVLQRAEEAFGGGVVPVHSGPAGAGADAVCLAEPGEPGRGILSSLAAVKDRAGLNVAVSDGHGQGVGDQAGAHVVRELPAGHHLGRQVDHRRQV